ncbi:MAG: nucleotidyltransferase domain-containing protein [Promethearchaeota archaeon]
MYKLCRIDIENLEEIHKKLNVFINKLKKLFKIQDIYLYGSFYTGKIHEGSDIDLIIVGDFNERFFERIGKILSLTDLPIEPLVYTKQEFEELIRSKNPFILEIIKNSRKL